MFLLQVNRQSGSIAKVSITAATVVALNVVSDEKTMNCFNRSVSYKLVKGCFQLEFTFRHSLAYIVMVSVFVGLSEQD